MDMARTGDLAAVITPIQWADQWIDGWFGSANRGINRYDHIDTAGYPSGYYVQWSGDPGVTQFGNVSDCSSFSDVLMLRAYDWIPPTTHPRPLAEDYYWAIRNGVHFTPIARVGDIAVGDVIALLYGDTDSQGDSGHVAWIDAVPVSYSDGPAETGLSQFAVTVDDSADGFHHSPDTANQDDRYLGSAACATDAQCVSQYGANSVCDSWQMEPANVCAFTGAGRGRMRLYADPSGNVVGYTWSTSAASTYYARPSPAPESGVVFTGRDIVIGRYL